MQYPVIYNFGNSRIVSKVNNLVTYNDNLEPEELSFEHVRALQAAPWACPKDDCAKSNSVFDDDFLKSCGITPLTDTASLDAEFANIVIEKFDEFGERHWEVQCRCVECGLGFIATITDDIANVWDSVLADNLYAIRRDAASLALAVNREQLVRFAKLLEFNIIKPEDFF